MTTIRGFLLLAAVAVGSLLPPLFSAAQAPVADVFVQVGGVEYQCYPVTHTTDEAPHETPTFAPPATFTQVPSVTPESATLPTLAATAIPKITPTPSAYPTGASTPMSSCTGTVDVGSSLNVRATPSVYAAVLGRLYNGALIDLHAFTFGDGIKWYRVWWVNNGQWGYIAAPYVTENEIACGGLLED